MHALEAAHPKRAFSCLDVKGMDVTVRAIQPYAVNLDGEISACFQGAEA